MLSKECTPIKYGDADLMSNVSMINYTTRDFISKTELELFIAKQDQIYTPEVVDEFTKAGMLRRVVTQIWNREGAFRVGIIFEYKDQESYIECQALIEKYVLEKFKDFTTKAVGSRGVVVHEFYSKDFI